MVSKVSLKSHMKIHDGKGGGMPCKCDICGREFTRRHLMERHRTFKHINLQTEFKCSECPKVFGHQSECFNPITLRTQNGQNSMEFWLSECNRVNDMYMLRVSSSVKVVVCAKYKNLNEITKI